MFVETLTAPAEEWRTWVTRLRFFTEPPLALVGCVAWRLDDGTVTLVSVWDRPGAVADFYLERVEPLIATDGTPPAKPVRHGEPVMVYQRGAVSTMTNEA
jgi:hypothetical protein